MPRFAVRLHHFWHNACTPPLTEAGTHAGDQWPKKNVRTRAGMRGAARHTVGVALVLLAFLAGCQQEADPRHATGGDAGRGATLIQSYGCGACHTVPGIETASASVGPPLSSYSSRIYVAGILPNSAEHLVRWIRFPQKLHPGSAMPDLGVTEADARDMAAYLYAH